MRAYNPSDVDVFYGGNYICPVAGVSYYTKALFFCWHDEDVFGKLEAKYLKVHLVLQDDNPHDQWAVAVMSMHGLIGYLPRRIAIMYRQEYKGRNNLSVNAKIMTTNIDEAPYCVRLDLPYLEDDEIPLKPIYSADETIHWHKQPLELQQS